MPLWGLRISRSAPNPSVISLSRGSRIGRTTSGEPFSGSFGSTVSWTTATSGHGQRGMRGISCLFMRRCAHRLANEVMLASQVRSLDRQPVLDASRVLTSVDCSRGAHFCSAPPRICGLLPWKKAGSEGQESCCVSSATAFLPVGRISHKPG